MYDADNVDNIGYYFTEFITPAWCLQAGEKEIYMNNNLWMMSYKTAKNLDMTLVIKIKLQ